MAKSAGVRILPGLLILLLGVLLLLDSLGVMSFGSVVTFWPLALVAFGVHVATGGGNRILGGLLALVGVALQVENLGWVDVRWRQVWNWWPLALMVVGILILLKPSKRENLFWGGAFTAVGAFYQGRHLGWFDVDLWALWPAAVIAAGIGMMRKAWGK